MLVVISSSPLCMKWACNGRQLVSEPEWTRVRPSLYQKYFLMDEQFMAVSWNVVVDSTDIG